MSLQKLIKPKSAAIVGVSDQEGKFGQMAALNLKKSNLSDVYFIHPSKDRFFGRPCYPSLSDLPGPVDCAVICTPSDTVGGILEECGTAGIPAAIVFASGFSEERSEKGAELENELVEIASLYKLTVLGPNCLGVYNAADDIYLWGMDTPHIPTEENTGIGVAAQSGWIVETFIDTDYTDIAYGLSTGNGNIITLEECLEFMVDQEEVRVVALYIEGLKKPDIFIRALKKAARKRKPIVILKGGRTELGAASAASHTGNLAGSLEAYQGIFKKYGVIAVDDFDQLITMTHTLSILNGNLPVKPAYGGLALSGGENTLFADISTSIGLDLPPFSDETKTQLEAHIPAFATPLNPCDTTTHLFFNDSAIQGVLTAVDSDPRVGATFISVNINQEETSMWHHFCQSLAVAKQACRKPLFAIPASEGSRNGRLRRLLEEAGIPMMASPATSLKCLRYLADYVEYRPEARLLSSAAGNGESKNLELRALTESDSKRSITEYGVPVPNGFVVQSIQEIRTAMKALDSPVVLKINSTDILHKTEVGGVQLNIQTEEQAIAAYKEIQSRIKETSPDAEINGILIEEMQHPGLELIVGVKNDPQLGPMLLVGLGGIFVEVFEDIVIYPAPINGFEAHEMLKSLKSYALLEGARGTQRYDIEALIELMVKVGSYAIERRATLKELDLNPIIVYPQGQGAVAVDALVIEYSNQRDPIPGQEGEPSLAKNSPEPDSLSTIENRRPDSV